MAVSFRDILPGEMGEGFVGIGHSVDVLASGHGGAFFIEGGHEFIGQTDMHGFALFSASGGQDPAKCQGPLAFGSYLHRHLVTGAADASAADLNHRFNILDRRFEDLQRLRILDSLGDNVHRIIENALGGGLFPFPHQAIDKLGNQLTVVLRVGLQLLL